MYVLLAFSFCILCYVNANNARRNLQNIPPPAPYYNEEASLGVWYNQYRLPGCGFDSSDTYTDYVQSFVRHKKGYVSYDTWRNDVTHLCNTLPTMYYRTPTPGLFKIKDAIGSVWSGKAMNVAIDVKRYKIFYGCSKMSVTGRCDDPFMNIYTRMIKPDPMTLAEIDSILRKMFGFSLASLPRTYFKRQCNAYGGGKIY